MAFQTPITVRQSLDRVRRREYVLPMIQRDFVWKPAQICQLFDSLMKGYPIGTFLFWRVKRENTTAYRFHDFVRDYHQRDTPRVPTPAAVDHDVTAVLDGQQRLTALNIGLLGSYAVAPTGGKADDPADYPRKRLYLNVLSDAPTNEDGLTHDFRFLTDEGASARDGGHFWFPVGRSLALGEAEIQALVDLPYRDPRAFAVLSLLFPHADLRNKFHTDHVFPKSRFTPARLARAGVAAADAKVFRDQCERLANLQLLEGVFNVPKSATLPADWLSGQFPDPVERQAYTDRHDLGDVPAAITDFGAFYAARRARLVARLRRTLGVVEPTPAGSGDGAMTPAALLGELNAHLGTTWTEQEVPGRPLAPGWSASREVLEAWAARSKTTLGQWSEPARRALERWWSERKRGGA